jgi:hypothetical protein
VRSWHAKLESWLFFLVRSEETRARFRRFREKLPLY